MAEPTSFLQSPRSSVRKNPLTCLLRDHLWRSKTWSTKRFWRWVTSFNPQVVLLQAGDMPYLYDLALIVCQKTQSKLVIYNSEDYYFKTWNYMKITAAKSTGCATIKEASAVILTGSSTLSIIILYPAEAVNLASTTGPVRRERRPPNRQRKT